MSHDAAKVQDDAQPEQEEYGQLDPALDPELDNFGDGATEGGGAEGNERLQQIMQIGTQILLPLVPQMAQWGLTFDLKKFVELLSKYGDMPEIADLVSSIASMEGEETVQAPGQRAANK